MIGRYENAKIAKIWTDEYKLKLWQKTELAVIHAREKLGRIPMGTYKKISGLLLIAMIDVEWWKERDREIHHDLNAFIDERVRCLPPELHQYFHEGLTSYDTEEAPFQTMILESFQVIKELLVSLMDVMFQLAHEQQETVMIGRTHGQQAKLQSFGKRVLTWIAQLNLSVEQALFAEGRLGQSKLSGAIGNYQGLDPELEEEALKEFGFTPFYGATQIVPRELHAALADGLSNIVLTIGKIAEDVRLGSRSGLPINHEPFGKKQKGSSAMPHKKNTIRTEQLVGLTRLDLGYLLPLKLNIMTWEERAIEQSCVERVAWPDLFHVTARSITVLTNVLSGLVVYEDNMHKEVKGTYGTYASEDAKDFLKRMGADVGLEHEDAYRIVQLASFNARRKQIFVADIIPDGCLEAEEDLDNSEKELKEWNIILRDLFREKSVREEFMKLFTSKYQLRGEHILFEKICPIDIPLK